MWLSVSFPICNIIPVTLPAVLFNVKRKSQESLSLALKHTKPPHKLNKANALRSCHEKYAVATEAGSWILW